MKIQNLPRNLEKVIAETIVYTSDFENTKGAIQLLNYKHLTELL